MRCLNTWIIQCVNEVSVWFHLNCFQFHLVILWLMELGVWFIVVTLIVIMATETKAVILFLYIYVKMKASDIARHCWVTLSFATRGI